MQDDQRARLLVVDDEPRIRAGLRDLLSLMGYLVDEAGSGREALQALESSPYDLVILDIRMPGMDGDAVMNRIRQTHPDLPIIIVTAHASLESAIAAVRSGAADYLHKPIDIEALADTVSRALKKHSEAARRQHVLKAVGEALDTLKQPETTATEPFPSGASVDQPSMSPETPPVSVSRFLGAGPLTLDCQTRLVTVTGDPSCTVELTESEAAILEVLMAHSDQVLSCTQLARTATGYDLDRQDAESVVRPCIHRLRRKVEANPETPRLIWTVRDRGYILSPA